MRRSTALGLSGILFLGVYLSGFFLSSGKHLWLDEHYSITRSITSVSYAQIWRGELDWESSRSPLFYVTQKFLCDLFSYDPRYVLPAKSLGTFIFYGDPFANTFLRLIPLFFMALAPALFFYYFSRRYSWGWGGLAALLCMSSWLFWWYGLEARPYIHFFTLTVIQGLIFLEVFRQKIISGRLWFWFGAVNVLLALTMTTCSFQIALMGAACVAYFRGSLAKKKVFLVFVLPIIIAFYYFPFGLHGRFLFAAPLYAYYLSNIPLEIMLVAVLFFACASFSWIDKDEWDNAMPAIFLLGSLSFVYFFLMVYMRSAGLSGQGGSPFAHRYLINLVPVGVIAMTIFCRALFHSLKGNRLKILFIVLLAAVLVWRFFHTYSYVHVWVAI